MNSKRAKPNGRKSKDPYAPKPAASRTRTKTFQDGSALILDERGGTIGLIEARQRYRVGKRANSERLAGKPG
jgi:hypothetical protein